MNALRSFLRYLPVWTFQACFARPMLKLFWGTRYRRRSVIPKDRACLVVANHNSHLDAALLMSLFPLRRAHRVHPVAAADYFGTNAIRRLFAMRFLNAIPIERHAAPGKDPLHPMIEALEAGESLIFFPEGSRGDPGVVAPFRPGIGRLVRAIPGLEVVPVFMAGPERIWPRGAALPLPLPVDVNVGKPRSYPAELDPREIADRVRDDVLALAPPPPPFPGPRPAPPVRVAVCGVDRESVRVRFRAIADRLGGIDRTIGVSEPIVESTPAGTRDLPKGLPLARGRWWPRALGWAFRTQGSSRGSKFAEMVDRSRIDESLQDGRSARFVVLEGSPLVDLLAYAAADFYAGVVDELGLQQILLYLAGERRVPIREWGRFLRKAPEVWLLNIFDLTRPHAPDILVLVRDAAAGGFEARLQEAYAEVAKVLERRFRVEVVAVDPGGDPHELARAVESIVRRVAHLEPVVPVPAS